MILIKMLLQLQTVLLNWYMKKKKKKKRVIVDKVNVFLLVILFCTSRYATILVIVIVTMVTSALTAKKLVLAWVEVWIAATVAIVQVGLKLFVAWEPAIASSLSIHYAITEPPSDHHVYIFAIKLSYAIAVQSLRNHRLTTMQSP